MLHGLPCQRPDRSLRAIQGKRRRGLHQEHVRSPRCCSVRRLAFCILQQRHFAASQRFRRFDPCRPNLAASIFERPCYSVDVKRNRQQQCSSWDWQYPSRYRHWLIPIPDRRFSPTIGQPDHAFLPIMLVRLLPEFQRLRSACSLRSFARPTCRHLHLHPLQRHGERQVQLVAA